jgi:hypothetical protein
MNKALNPKVLNSKPWVGYETKGEKFSLNISENQSAQLLFQERTHNGSLENIRKPNMQQHALFQDRTHDGFLVENTREPFA